jgi:hypothetical protein
MFEDKQKINTASKEGEEVQSIRTLSFEYSDRRKLVTFKQLKMFRRIFSLLHVAFQ